MKTPIISVTRKDLEVQTFRSGGSGGQHQNKTDSGVRIIHKDSGAVGESREHKSQLQNKKAALKRLSEHPKFKMWLSEKLVELDTGKTIEEAVNEQMTPDKIRIEGKDEHERWVVL